MPVGVGMASHGQLVGLEILLGCMVRVKWVQIIFVVLYRARLSAHNPLVLIQTPVKCTFIF